MTSWYVTNVRLGFWAASLRVFFIICALLTGNHVFAVNAGIEAKLQPLLSQQEQSAAIGGSYCGLYAVYTASRIYKTESISFTDLLTPRYHTSRPAGSSLAQLKQACDDIGLNAKAVRMLSPVGLEEHPGLSLIHVTAFPNSSDYDHWFLVIETSSRGVRVFDPPAQPRWITWDELAARWGGAALLIGPDPVPGIAGDQMSFWSERWLNIWILGPIAVSLALLNAPLQRYCASKHLWIEFAAGVTVILGGGLVLAGVYPLVLPAGYQMSSQQIQQVQYRHRLDFLPTIEVAVLEQRIRSGDVLVIDSRYVSDYLAAHIPGSLSLPVTLDKMEVRTKMNEIPLATPLVIYCQSMGCDFDEQMAARLLDIGYRDITIFAGGWVAWENDARTRGPGLTTERVSGE